MVGLSLLVLGGRTAGIGVNVGGEGINGWCGGIIGGILVPFAGWRQVSELVFVPSDNGGCFLTFSILLEAFE